jgi:Tol biopolymer transport system component
VANAPGTPIFLVPPDGGNPKELIATNLPALSSNGGSLLGDRPWSKDDQTLLVSRSIDGGPFAIHRVNRETDESEPLTSPPADTDDSTATYSFDHRQILFRRGEMGAFGRMTLMVMPAAGGDPQPLYEDDNIVTAAWRPDGQRIVFMKTRSLWELDVATRKTRQLAAWTKRVQSLTVSPDDRIVYSDFWHDQFLYVVDLATGERRQITAHANNNGGARFAPDGRVIAYASNRTANPEVWLYSLDDRSETRLTGDGGQYTDPEWSPDGRRLVVRSDQNGGVPKMFVVSADGTGGPRLLVDQPIDGGMNISDGSRHRWSPDGKLISYPRAGDKGLELWTVGPDGEGASKRLDGVSEFDWYRGSRRGLVTRLRGSETELSAVDLETGQEQPLFTGPLQEIDVAPDGRAVSFLFGRGHFSMGLAVLKLVPPSDAGGLPAALGEPEYVVPTEGTWHVHNGGWSPDSRRIVYTHDQDYGDIYELKEEPDHRSD